MQTNPATVIAAVVVGKGGGGGVGVAPNPLPYHHCCHVSQPKLVKWNCCSIQGVRFLPSDDSRSTMKQDRFSLCLNNCLLMRTQLSIADSIDTVKISKRFACANELNKWHFGNGVGLWSTARFVYDNLWHNKSKWRALIGQLATTICPLVHAKKLS